MEVFIRAIRGFMNVLASALLLLLATSLLITAMNTPAAGSASASWWPLASLGAALFSGFIAMTFWAQRKGRHSYHVSAMINGLSTVAFVSFFVLSLVSR